jgi:hypothetical protein
MKTLFISLSLFAAITTGSFATHVSTSENVAQREVVEASVVETPITSHIAKISVAIGKSCVAIGCAAKDVIVKAAKVAKEYTWDKLEAVKSLPVHEKQSSKKY